MSGLQSVLTGSGPVQYWVSGTTYAQGDMRRSPADHQVFTRIVAGAGTADPSSDATNWRPEGMRAIKSIQRGVITVPGGAFSATATITSVNTAKSELRFLGGRGHENTSAHTDTPRLSLTNSTTITATVFSDDHIASFVSWEITEYY